MTKPKLQTLPKGRHDIGGYPLTQKGRKALKKPAPEPAKQYPAGYFTEPVRAWEQMQFRSQIRVDRKTGRFETSWAESLRIRSSGGWDKHTITQPGSVQYVIAGPVQVMERAR